MSEDVVAIGRVLAAFGTRGELKVAPLGRFPSRFQQLGRVLVGEAHQPITVERARRQGQGVLLKLADIDTPETARGLQHQYLYVPEAEAVQLPCGEYFVWQVVGLRVQTVDGVELGQVREVLSTGSNDVYVVHGGRGEILVPALRDVVRTVDVEAGTMTVALPAGLLD